MAGIGLYARVDTANDFPVSVGFASSASAYAALSLAGSRAAGLDMSERALSSLARKGSGSACRSIPDGFVEWQAGNDDASSYAVSIASRAFWKLAFVSVLLSAKPKTVSSQEGHQATRTSPCFNSRLSLIGETVGVIREGLLSRDFNSFGMAVEREAIVFHAIAMTSRVPNHPWMSGIYYWEGETMRLIQAVQRWRCGGLPVYLTLDAGSTVHLICEKQYLSDVKQLLLSDFSVINPDMVISFPGRGAWIVE